MEQKQSADLAVINLPAADRAAIALSSTSTEKQLRNLIAKSNGIVSIIDKAGRDEAHGAAMELRAVRTSIAKTGKLAREDAQAFAKAVISEETRLISIVQPEEDRVLGLRDGYDAKIAAEKAEIARKEAERKAGLQAKVDAIRNLPLGMDGETAAEIAVEIEALRQFVPGEEFMEYADAATEAAYAAINAMTALHERQIAKEAEAAEMERQRAENARVAAEQEAERQRLAALAAEQAERDRVAAIERQAEHDKIAAAQQAAADAIAAERAALQAERDALNAYQAKLKEQAEADQRRKDELAAAEVEAQRVIDSTPKVEYPAPTAEQAGLPTSDIDQTVVSLPDDAGLTECGEPELTVDATRPGGIVVSPASPPAPLQFSYSDIADVLTIEGINYAGEMFRQLGGAFPIGVPLTIMERKGGVLTVFRGDEVAA